MTETTMNKLASEPAGALTAPRRDHMNRRGLVGIALALVVGLGLGAAFTMLVSNDTATPARRTTEPAAVSPSASGRAVNPVSADAAERAAVAEQQAQYTLCISSPISADAADRCIAADANLDARENIERGRAAESARLQAQADAYLSSADGEG